ncbi:MAG: pyruvate dehydrogenase (acetyl-transferring) E1 component subunit alpha [Bacteroidota bacterium]
MASDTPKTAAKSAASRNGKTAANGTASRNGKTAANGAASRNGKASGYTISVQVPHYEAAQHDHKALGLTDEHVLEMYRNMLLQRRFEERAAQMYGKQKIAGFLHLYIGQEAVSTGTAYAMRIGEDSLITAYRDHGHGLALGMTANECMAELFGKIDGSSRGKGGSMHYFSKELKMMGGHGIVGAHIPLATGLAFANKYKDEDTVAICFFGDGAMHQGAYHEAANLAGLYDLPVIFCIENNGYAMGTSVERAAADPDLYKQGVPYGLHAAVVNGMDVFDVYAAMKDYIEKARNGEPSLLEIRTYRYRGHSMSDPQKYRTKEELDSKKEIDPIIRLKAYILEHDLSDNDALDVIDDEVKAEVMASVEFAENSPFPDESTIYEDIYTQKDYPFLA